MANLWRKAASRQGAAPLWILSAGYGLIPSDAEIAPYAATLSPNDDDSVAGAVGAQDLKAWWNQLAEWPGPSPGSARSLLELAEECPRTLWIVVGGSQYMYALADQLQDVHTADGHAGRYVLVSPGLSGRRNIPAIEKALLQADSRWEEKLGRGKVTIGIRIATHLFERADGNPNAISSARAQMQQEVESLEGLKTPLRAPRSDVEVLRHLRVSLKKQPDVSFSRALRDFRDSGMACEYKRFRGLYQEVKESLHAKAE
ncbi:MAG: hypothetical protein IPG75_20855 [Gemmatimonadetes bacterium]|nr:hypothetical protein [Gemmatimonadota bacterium]